MKRSASGKSRGQFKSSCICKIHNHDTSGELYNLNLKDRRLKKATIDQLIASGYVDENAKKYGKICKTCIDSILGELGGSSSTSTDELSTSSSPRLPSTSSATSKQGSSTCTSYEITRVCAAIEALVKKDVAALHRVKRPTTESLLAYTPKAWLEARPTELIKLIASICGIDPHDDKKSYVLAKAVEQIYYIRNSRLVLPLSFRESLLIYTWTKSKQAVTLDCANSPSSSYTTVNRYLMSEAGNEILVPSGVVRCAFDNNQIIGKTYIIKGTNKVPTSVMTSTAYTQLNTSRLQEDEPLKPENWMWKKESEDVKEGLLKAHENPVHVELLRKTRNAHINKYLDIVAKQQECKDGHCTDYIDKHITKEMEAQQEKICEDCGSVNDKTYRFCRVCGGPLIKPVPPNINDAANKAEPRTSNAQSSFKEYIPVSPNEAKVIPGEPEFVNPNSYETIVKVIQSIGQRAGIARYGGNTRQWLFLECDGLPYKIMRDLMDNVFICTRCNTSFYGEDKVNSDEHRCYTLHGNQPIIREFDWLVPVMGLLHLEMNAARAFIKLNWEVFVSHLAFAVGFESPKAQAYCRKGSDHHKTWDLLQIMYISLTEELLLPYVREAAGEHSVQGYWDWCASNMDPNYCYVQLMAFTYLHSLMVFRVGVRHNDMDAIFAGRVKFEPLFYAQNHPKYQDILYRDSHDQLMMPRELKFTLHETFTFNRTGNKGHYQGGDATLEEINREGKGFITCVGVPNEEQWKKVFRNLEKMKEIRESTMSDAGMTLSTTESVKYISIHAIGRARAAVRKSCYLQEPKDAKQHKSIDGVELNPNLSAFAKMAETKRIEYIENRLKGEQTHLNVIPVTLEAVKAQEDIRNKSNKAITTEVLTLIDQLPLDVASVMEDDFRKNIKGKRKDILVEFYHRVVEEHADKEDNDVLPTTSETESSDDEGN